MQKMLSGPILGALALLAAGCGSQNQLITEEAPKPAEAPPHDAAEAITLVQNALAGTVYGIKEFSTAPHEGGVIVSVEDALFYVRDEEVYHANPKAQDLAPATSALPLGRTLVELEAQLPDYQEEAPPELPAP